MGALAEFERDLIRERAKAGMPAARKRGKHVGRPRALTPHQVTHALWGEPAVFGPERRRASAQVKPICRGSERSKQDERGTAVVALAEQAEQATDQTDRDAALYEIVDAVHALNRAYAALGLAAWGTAGLKLTLQSLSDRAGGLAPGRGR